MGEQTNNEKVYNSLFNTLIRKIVDSKLNPNKFNGTQLFNLFKFVDDTYFKGQILSQKKDYKIIFYVDMKTDIQYISKFNIDKKKKEYKSVIIHKYIGKLIDDIGKLFSNNFDFNMLVLFHILYTSILIFSDILRNKNKIPSENNIIKNIIEYPIFRDTCSFVDKYKIEYLTKKVTFSDNVEIKLFSDYKPIILFEGIDDGLYDDGFFVPVSNVCPIIEFDIDTPSLLEQRREERKVKREKKDGHGKKGSFKKEKMKDYVDFKSKNKKVKSLSSSLSDGKTSIKELSSKPRSASKLKSRYTEDKGTDGPTFIIFDDTDYETEKKAEKKAEKTTESKLWGDIMDEDITRMQRENIDYNFPRDNTCAYKALLYFLNDLLVNYNITNSDKNRLYNMAIPSIGANNMANATHVFGKWYMGCENTNIDLLDGVCRDVFYIDGLNFLTFDISDFKQNYKGEKYIVVGDLQGTVNTIKMLENTQLNLEDIRSFRMHFNEKETVFKLKKVIINGGAKTVYNPQYTELGFKGHYDTYELENGEWINMSNNANATPYVNHILRSEKYSLEFDNTESNLEMCFYEKQ